MYDRSLHCFVYFSSQIACCLIGHDNLVPISMWTTPVQSISSLSCLVFIIDHTLLEKSWKFTFDFDIDRTCTISLVVVLYHFHHKLYPIRSAITVQLHFQSRAKLYGRSHRFPVSSLSQTAHYPINLDSSVLYSAKIIPLQSDISLFCLVFLIDNILFDRS